MVDKRSSPRTAVFLRRLGVASIGMAAICLVGSFVGQNDLLRAYCLGAFVCGLLAGLLTLGSYKFIALSGEASKMSSRSMTGQAP